MASKSYNTRIINKHDVAANWELAVNFIPKQGEIIVYDIDETHSYARFKIGDGVTEIKQLPFATDTTLAISGMAADAKLTGDELKKRITINLENSEEGEANPIDADTLGGVSADDYALKEDLENFSSGSDWAQNNSEAKDYIKNRTHYTLKKPIDTDNNLGTLNVFGIDLIKVENYSILEETGFNTGRNFQIAALLTNLGKEVQLDIINQEIASRPKGEDLKDLEQEIKPSTTISYLVGSLDNTEYVYIIPEGGVFDDSGIFIVSSQKENISNLTVTIFKTLDEEYIPSTIARQTDLDKIVIQNANWLENDALNQSYIYNRTHWYDELGYHPLDHN